MNLTNLTDLLNLDKVLVLDLETTVKYINGKTDNSPFNRKQMCWCLVVDDP